MNLEKEDSCFIIFSWTVGEIWDIDFTFLSPLIYKSYHEAQYYLGYLYTMVHGTEGHGPPENFLKIHKYHI